MRIITKSARPSRTMDFLNRHLVYTGDDCVLWPWSTNPINGYGGMKYGDLYGAAHRFVCRLAHGEPPSPDHVAAHSCHVRHCINPNHISWKTHSENMLDKRENGTANNAWWGKKGKLTVEQAADVLALKGITTQAAIAEMYRVTESNVRAIHTGKTWARRIEKMQAA